MDIKALFKSYHDALAARDGTASSAVEQLKKAAAELGITQPKAFDKWFVDNFEKHHPNSFIRNFDIRSSSAGLLPRWGTLSTPVKGAIIGSVIAAVGVGIWYARERWTDRVAKREVENRTIGVGRGE